MSMESMDSSGFFRIPFKCHSHRPATTKSRNVGMPPEVPRDSASGRGRVENTICNIL